MGTGRFITREKGKFRKRRILWLKTPFMKLRAREVW